MKKLITTIKTMLFTLTLALSSNIFAQTQDGDYDVKIDYKFVLAPEAQDFDDGRLYDTKKNSWDKINDEIRNIYNYILEQPSLWIVASDSIVITLLKDIKVTEDTKYIFNFDRTDDIFDGVYNSVINEAIDKKGNKVHVVIDLNGHKIEAENDVLPIYTLGFNLDIDATNGGSITADTCAILIGEYNDVDDKYINLYGGEYTSKNSYAVYFNKEHYLYNTSVTFHEGCEIRTNNVEKAAVYDCGEAAKECVATSEYEYNGEKLDVNVKFSYYPPYSLYDFWPSYESYGIDEYGLPVTSFKVKKATGVKIIPYVFDDGHDLAGKGLSFSKDSALMYNEKGERLNFYMLTLKYGENNKSIYKYDLIDPQKELDYVTEGETIEFQLLFSDDDMCIRDYNNNLYASSLKNITEVSLDYATYFNGNYYARIYVPSLYFEYEIDKVSRKTTYNVTNAEELVNALKEIEEASSESDGEKAFGKIILRNDIDLNGTVTITDENNVVVTEPYKLVLGTKDNPFNGLLEGNGFTISNIITEGTSIFGYIGSVGIIRNVIVETNFITDGVGIGEEGEKVVSIFADGFDGQINNTGAILNVIPKGELTDNDDVNISWVNGVGENADINKSFVYVRNNDNKSAQAGGNKVCVVLKQNMVVGKGKGRTYKVCQGPKGGNKSLIVNPDPTTGEEYEEINKEQRECTAEQFANGEVAYWLNYDGQGYTKAYNKLWSQGDEYPVLSSSRSAYLVKLLYVIEGTATEADINATLNYAKVGDEVDLAYTRQPDKITIDGEEATLGTDKATFVVPETDEEVGIVTVQITFPATAISQSKASEITISVKGNNIVVDNVANQKVELFDMNGHCLISQVSQRESMTIVVPENGIYVVKAGDETKKVRIEY